MKAKNRLTLFGIVLALLLVLSNLDATAINSNGTGGGNWNSTSSWNGGVVPTSADDVVILNGDVINVTNSSSTPAACYDLTVNSGGTLQPGIGASYIEVDGNLQVDAGGLVNYSNSTGTLNWTFYGIDGNNTIINANGDGTKANDIKLAMNDVVIAGTMITPASGDDNFYIYGDFTVNGLGDWNSGVDTKIYFDNAAQQTLSNSSACEFENLIVVAGASITASSDFTVTDDLIIEATGVMAISTSAGIVTISDGSGAGQINASGTLTFGSGTELIIGGTTTLLADITGFDGTLTASDNLNVGAYSISGTGDFNLSSGKTLTLNNANGVDGAINLTGTRTFSTGASYIFQGGTTGFADAGVTSLVDMTITAATTSAESWSMTGALDVTGGSFVQSSGTVTMNGATNVGLNASAGGAMTLNNLVIANTANTITLGLGLTITGSFTQSGAGTFDLTTLDITFTGTGTITKSAGTLTFGVGSQFIINDAAADITLGSALDFGATGNMTLTTGTLNLSTYDLNGTLAGGALTLTAGTLKTASTGGFEGNLGAGITQVNVASGMNFEFTGAATTMGFDITATANGTGTGGGAVNNVNDVTLGGTTVVVSTGSAATTTTVTGAFTVQSGGSCILAAGLIIMDNGSSIDNSSGTDANLTFFDLQIGNAAGADAVTTSSNFSIAGDLNIDGTAADTFAATGSTITMTAASGAATMNGVNGALGTLTLNNLTWANANNITSNANMDDLVVTGNLAETGAGDVTLNVATVLTMSGTSKTISFTGGGTVSLGALTISGTVTTASSWTEVTGSAVSVTGTFAASAGTITFATTGSITGAGTKTFYTISFGGNISCAVDLTIAGDLTRTGGIWTQSTGTMTMTGTAATITTGASTNLLFSGAASALTIANGAVVTIAEALQVSHATATMTVATGGKILTDDADAIDGIGIFVLSSGATWEANNVGGFEASIDHTTLATTTFNADANYILGAAVTDAGLNVTTPITDMMDLTIRTGASVTAFSGDVNISGDLLLEGTAGYIEATVTQVVTLDGTNKTITVGSGTLTFGKLVVSGTVTSASSFGVANTTATALNVSGSLICSAGTFTHGGAAGGITNSGTLTFFGLTVAATIDITTGSSFTIADDLTMAAATSSLTASAGTITFTSTGGAASITAAANAAGSAGIEFYSVSIEGVMASPATDAFIIEVAGTAFGVTSSGSFIQDGTAAGGINFINAGGTTTITNAGTLTFADLYVDNGDALGVCTVATTSSFTISDDFTMGGAADVFSATGGTVTLSGTTTTPSLTTLADSKQTFNNLTITGSITQVGDFVVDVSGNLDVSGTFDANDLGSINFIGGTTKTLTNTGTITFSKLSIASTASNKVTTSSDFTISDQLIVGALGQFDASGGGTITFTDAVGTNPDISLSTTSATAVKFNSMAISTATITSTDDKDFQVYGDISNTSTGAFEFGLTGTTTKVWFVGSNQQTITNSSTGHVHFFNATLNNTNGLLLAGDAAVDEIKIFGTLRLQNGDIDLNGNNVLTIDNASTAKLSETPGNTVLNTGPSTSTGNVTVVGYTPGATLTNYNVGGLGAKLTTSADPGATTIARYHIAREPGSSAGISRYYSITTANGSLNSTLTMLYDDSEIGVLTEADLQLLYADAAAGPWIYESGFTKDATNNLFRKTGIAQYTGEKEWWTAGVPSIITTTQLTKGVETSPLTAGTNDKAIYGLQFTSSAGTVDVTDWQVDLTALATPTQLSGYKVWSSTDNDFSTTSDNTELTLDATTGGAATDVYVAFDLASNALTVTPGVPLNLFLTANVASTVISTTGTITPAFVHGDLTINNGVMSTSSETGTAYSFQAGMMFDENPNGVPTSPLTAGASDIAILGFKANATANASMMTEFDVTFNSSPTGVYSNYRLYRSNDNLYTAGSETEINMDATYPDTSGNTVTFKFTGDPQGLNTSASYKYYYIVADVDGSVDGATAAMTATISHSTVVGSNAGPRYMETDQTTAATTITGSTYSFETSTATVSSSNVAAGNLGKNVRNQPIYGFTITPDNSNSVTFTGVTAHVTFGGGSSSSEFTNYKLWADANENGYPDPTESIATGTYTAATTKGNLTFSTFSTTQTFSSATKYLITANVSNSATTDGTISIQIYDQNYVTLTSPASVNTTNAPFTGNTMTIKAVGTPDHLAIVGTYSTAITTGGTVDLAVQVQDANNIPVNATSNVGITLINSGASVLASNTGTITSGTNFITISPTVTNATGTTTETISATDDAALLTTSSATSAITVLVAAPAVGAEEITFGVATSTSVIISSVANGNGSRRIIVVRAGLPPDSPVNGVSYTAASNIENAGDVGTGQTAAGSFVVYEGSGVVPSTTVQGLVAGQKYFFQVFEYNGTGSLINYITTATSVNPKSSTTSDGGADPYGAHQTAATAANIMTDVDVSGAIAAANEEDYFVFSVPTGKNNLKIELTGLPANYELELYDASAGNTPTTMVLMRASASTGTTNETIILNDATVSGPYIIKIYGVDSSAYSSTAYTVKVGASSTSFLSSN